MDTQSLAYLTAGVGAILGLFGGAWGISRLATVAMDSIARQPESANDIRGVCIITAAMIEGIALLALVICFLLQLK